MSLCWLKPRVAFYIDLRFSHLKEEIHEQTQTTRITWLGHATVLIQTPREPTS